MNDYGYRRAASDYENRDDPKYADDNICHICGNCFRSWLSDEGYIKSICKECYEAHYNAVTNRHAEDN